VNQRSTEAVESDGFLKSPFLGHGPAKSIFSEVITDSEYLDVLKEFGSVGFFAYLGYYLYPIFVIWAYLRPNSRTPWAFHQISPADSWFMLLFCNVVHRSRLAMGRYWRQQRPEQRA